MKKIICIPQYGIGWVYPTQLFVDKPPNSDVAYRNPYYLSDNRQEAAIFSDDEKLADFARTHIAKISDRYRYEYL